MALVVCRVARAGEEESRERSRGCPWTGSSPLQLQRFCCRRRSGWLWARAAGYAGKPRPAVATWSRLLSLGSKEGPFVLKAAGKWWKPAVWLPAGTWGLHPQVSDQAVSAGSLSAGFGSSWRIKQLRAWASARLLTSTRWCDFFLCD